MWRDYSALRIVLGQNVAVSYKCPEGVFIAKETKWPKGYVTALASGAGEGIGL